MGSATNDRDMAAAQRNLDDWQEMRGAPLSVRLPPLTCDARVRLDVCGQPAKRCYLGARCCLHFPAGVS